MSTLRTTAYELELVHEHAKLHPPDALITLETDEESGTLIAQWNSGGRAIRVGPTMTVHPHSGSTKVAR